MNKKTRLNIINTIEVELLKQDYLANNLIETIREKCNYSDRNNIRKILRTFDGLKWFSMSFNKKNKIYSISENVLSLEIVKTDLYIKSILLKCFQNIFTNELYLTSTDIKKRFYKELKNEKKIKYFIEKTNFVTIAEYFIQNYTVPSSTNIKRLILLTE